jgi:hypothetical protein
VAEIVLNAGQIEREPLLRFLDRVLTPRWLEAQYRECGPRTIPHAVLKLVFALPADLHTRLRPWALRARLESGLAAMAAGDPRADLDVLRLLGCAAVLEGRPVTRSSAWLSQAGLIDSMEADAITQNREQFGILDGLLWSGMREMARLRSDEVRVSPGEGELALASWSTLAGPSPFACAYNEAMVAWLEECRNAGWVLARPALQLRDEIVRILGRTSAGGISPAVGI